MTSTSVRGVRNHGFLLIIHSTLLSSFRSAEPFSVPGVHDLRAEDVPAVGVQVRRRLELRARHELRAGGRGAQAGRRRDEAAVQRALPRRGRLRLQVRDRGWD